MDSCKGRQALEAASGGLGQSRGWELPPCRRSKGALRGMRAESMLPFSEPGREEIHGAGVGWGGVGRG